MRILLTLLLAASSLSAAPRWTAWNTIQHLFPGFQILEGIFADTHQSGGGGNTFTLVQQFGDFFCNTVTTCTITGFTTTTAGNLLVLVGASDSSTQMSATSGWTLPAAGKCNNGGAAGSTAYMLNATALSTINIGVTSSVAMRVYLYEFHPSSTTATFINAGCTSVTGAAGSAAGIGFAGLTGNNVIVQTITDNAVTAINSSYTDLSTQAASPGIATADLRNTATSATPTWSTPSTGGITVFAAVFK